MSAEPHWLRRPWTLADLELLPDDGYRYEIIDGQIVVSPPPRVGHQLLTDALCALLRARGELAITGVGVHVSAGLGRQESCVIPDVVVVRRLPARDAVVVSAEDVTLAAEVISPGSRRRDEHTKLSLYAELGIVNYLLIDPEAAAVTHLQLRGGEYVPVQADVAWEQLMPPA